jgi:hypothetical protein
VPEKAPSTEPAPIPNESSPALTLQCTPPSTFSGNERDPVVLSYVSVHGTDWQVRHVRRSGAVLDRATQYGLHDASTPGVRIWEGTLLLRSQLKMTGQIKESAGNYVYVESLYDAKKKGEKVAEFSSSCRLSQ